jgi:hypothetical protein
MSTYIEAQIIRLHLRHFTQDQIIAALRTGKPYSQGASAISEKPVSFRKLDGSDEDQWLLHDWLTVGP